MLSMLMRVMRFGSHDTWVVYGRRSGPIATATAPTWMRFSHGVHKTCRSYEEAMAWLMAVKLQHAHEGAVDAVIVHMREGRDHQDYREVVHRMGEGKAWWE